MLLILPSMYRVNRRAAYNLVDIHLRYSVVARSGLEVGRVPVLIDIISTKDCARPDGPPCTAAQSNCDSEADKTGE